MEKKKSFEDYKNKKLKKSKNWDISKGLVHGFGQKCEIWPCFYFSRNKPNNEFNNILETKKCFQDCENEKLKNRKIGIFRKGLDHGFGQKCEIGPCFYFFAKLAKKMCLTIF